MGWCLVFSVIFQSPQILLKEGDFARIENNEKNLTVITMRNDIIGIKLSQSGEIEIHDTNRTQSKKAPKKGILIKDQLLCLQNPKRGKP